VAAALVTASLYLRRRTLLLAGGIAAFGYLGYLAFDVFRRVVALPIALAALGLLVIVATVWMQRRFPKLVDRVSREDAAGVKTLPAVRSRCSDRSPSRSRPWCSPGARPKSGP
jgi:O-antigen ligase